MGAKIRVRPDVVNLGGLDLGNLRAFNIIEGSLLDLGKLRQNSGLLREINLRETAGLDDEAKAEFIKSNKDLVLQIVAARVGREEDVLEETRRAKRDFRLFQLLKEADFDALRGFLRNGPGREIEPFIDKLVILFNGRHWGKISPKSGRRLKKYSADTWQVILNLVFEDPLTIITMPKKVFAQVCTGSINVLKAAMELFKHKQSSPEVYNFSNSQLVQMLQSPRRIRLILQKVYEYSFLPKKMRPSISRVVKIGLSACPEQRFEYLDSEIKKRPKSISHFVVLAGMKDFKHKIDEYYKLLERGEKLGLSSSVILLMFIAGISLDEIISDTDKSKDIGLTARSAITMRQAGLTVEDIKLFLSKIGFGLSTAKAVRLHTNIYRNILIPQICDFVERLETLRAKHTNVIAKERIPKYLADLALILACLKPDEFNFVDLHNKMENEILFENKNPKEMFKIEYFPLYLQLTDQYFEELQLIFGRRRFKISSAEVFVAARLGDFIYGDVTLQERVEDLSVPLPSELAILKEVVDRAQAILSPHEYRKLIKYFFEYEGGEIESSIMELIVRIREELEIEVEEEEVDELE